MSPLQQILGVRALLAPNDAWLPGRSFGAIDDAGHDRNARAPEAVRFGVLAGLVRLNGPVDSRLQAVGLICRAVGAKHLYAWEQDPGRTLKDVLAALDRAAELAQEADCR